MITKSKITINSIIEFVHNAMHCNMYISEDFYDEVKAPYLKEICNAIQEFENDDNEALIICMPPRHR